MRLLTTPLEVCVCQTRTILYIPLLLPPFGVFFIMMDRSAITIVTRAKFYGLLH